MPQNTVRDAALLKRGKELHEAGFVNCVARTGEKNNVFLSCGGACKLIEVTEAGALGPQKTYRVKCHHHGRELTPEEAKDCTKKVIPKISLH